MKKSLNSDCLTCVREGAFVLSMKKVKGLSSIRSSRQEIFPKGSFLDEVVREPNVSVFQFSRQLEKIRKIFLETEKAWKEKGKTLEWEEIIIQEESSVFIFPNESELRDSVWNTAQSTIAYLSSQKENPLVMKVTYSGTDSAYKWDDLNFE